MALRVLTSAEKETLKGSTEFTQNCYWAIRDYASYWSIHDGSGLADEAARLKWAKDRQNAVAIVLNDIGDQDIPLKFLKLAKGMQFDLGTAPETLENLLAAVLGPSYEELASLYFDQLGETINMSTTGN